MVSGRFLRVAAILALALGGVAAQADIINGDFSSGLDGYEPPIVSPESDPTLALVEVVGGRLHIRTANTYTWNTQLGQWLLAEPDYSAIVVSQDVAAVMGFWAPEGTTAIEFDADITVLNNPAGNMGAGLTFEVNYNGSYNTSGLLTDSDQTIRIEMPGLVVNGEVGISFQVSSLSILTSEPDPQFGESYTIIVDSYLDNIRFVPEPATAAVLAIGAAAIMMRRRRRA